MDAGISVMRDQRPIHAGYGPRFNRVNRGRPPEPRLFRLFFFNDTATNEIYTLSLHDALPICPYLIYDKDG